MAIYATNTLPTGPFHICVRALIPRRNTFRYSRQNCPNMVDTGPAARGAQKFPLTASIGISLSNIRSATALRSRSFSFWSSSVGEAGHDSCRHAACASVSRSVLKRQSGGPHLPSACLDLPLLLARFSLVKKHWDLAVNPGRPPRSQTATTGNSILTR